MTSQTPSRTEFDGITSYLSWDHDRLDAILQDVVAKVDGGWMEDALALYRRFDEGLRRHIRIEEELLFPVFEMRSGVGPGLTAVMRQEHREIIRALGMMREGLEQSDAARFRDGLSFLHAALPEHNAKEERILYPLMDRLLSAAERLILVRRLQRESLAGVESGTV